MSNGVGSWRYLLQGSSAWFLSALPKENCTTPSTELLQIIEKSLDNIVQNITRLNEEKLSIDTYDMRHKIDELFIEDLNTFVEARQSIVHAHGLNTYAEVMSDFAAGERYLNRVWSASADGYIDEVNTYLEKAKIQFVETLYKIRNIKK
ncbi:MAG: hypothetical protein ACYS5F_11230 [Planctomycetota bacterium]|jgi:hypothetical protein